MTKITDLLDRIYKQQIKICDVFGSDDYPERADGISMENLERLKLSLSARGMELPLAYEEFLLINDGISDISTSFHLHGSEFLMSDEYDETLEFLLENGFGFETDDTQLPLLIGSHEDTLTKVFFDFKHAQKIAGETMMFEGDPGFMTLHNSFIDFLNCRIEANEKTLQTLINMKNSSE